MDPFFKENKQKNIPIREAANRFGYSTGYLSNLCRTGKIVGTYSHNEWSVDIASLESFIKGQAERKEARARSLAHNRSLKYREHNLLPKPIIVPKPLGIASPIRNLISNGASSSVRGQALALSVATVVLVSAALVAQAAVIPQLAHHVATIASEIASGFNETFGDIPSHIVARIDAAEIEMRSASPRLRRASALVSDNFASSLLAELDFSTVRISSFGNENVPTHFSTRQLGGETAKLMPMLTVDELRMFAHALYENLTSPSLALNTLAHAYVAIGIDAYAAINTSFAAYYSLIEKSGAPTLALAASARDTYLLALAPLPTRFVTGFGTAIIDATHALIHADVATSYGLAAAAPASARATVALVGSVGDLLAGTTSRFPTLATELYLRATAAPSLLAPALAQAVFNAEYAGATHFVALSRIVSGQYLALIQGTGRLAYVGAKGTRDSIAATGPLLASTPLAFEDAYLGVLGKSALALNSVTQVPQVAAALAAVASKLSVGEQIALATYETIHDFFDATSRMLAMLFAPSPTIIVVNTTPKLPVATSSTGSWQATTSPLLVTTYPTYNSYPTYTTVVQGISPDFMNQSLATLRTDILSTVAGQVQPVATQTSLNVVNMYSESHPVVFTGLPLVSATVGNFGSLSAGNTTLGDTIVSGSLGLSGTLSSNTSAIAPYFIATSSTATSTFAGSLAIDTNGFVYSTSTRNVGIGTSSPTFALSVEGSSSLGNQAIAGFFTATSSVATSTFAGGLTLGGTGLVYQQATKNIGIGTTSPDATLSILQSANGIPFISAYRITDSSPSGDFISYKMKAGTTLFRVDNSGNLFAGGIINSGSQTITSTSQPQFRLQYDPSNEVTFSTGSTGTTTIGVNGSAPALFFTPQSNSVNTFNFTNALAANSILSIDTLNQRVGIGTTTPVQKLDINGTVGISGTQIIDISRNLTNIGTITSGAINKVTITAPATGSTLTIADGKTLTVSDSTTLATNSITFAGTESLTLAAAKSVSFADTFTTSGAFPLTLTTSASTNVTLPTTGTLATLAGAEALSNKTITASSFNGTTVIASGAITSGLINGQTISSAASFTGTVNATGAITASQFNGSGAGLTGTAASLNIGGVAASANLVNGTYTGGGGLQPPSYIPNGQVRFNMMSNVPGTSGYQDWLMMDTYTGGDVPYVTMIGVSKTAGAPVGYLAVGAKGGATWTSTPILTGANYNSYSPTLTGTGASGTWGISIFGNAVTAGGLAVATGRNNAANQIVRTDANGYLQTGYINSSNGNENNNSNADRVWGTNGGDDYLRTYRTSALSVGYAATAGSAPANGGTATYATYLWSTSHPGTYYISNAWDGTYWQLTSNHSSPVNVGHATVATQASYLNTTGLYYQGGNVGIGTTNPLSPLSVGTDGAANAGVYSHGTGYGVYGTGLYGLYGAGTNYGVVGSGGVVGTYGFGGAYGFYGSGTSYDFYATGAGVDYGSNSSIRWKSNVKELTGSLDTIMKLSGVSYNWDQEHGGRPAIGFIGEEIGKYYPEIVVFDASSTDPSYYVTGMDYSKMTPVLLEGIKELSLRSIGIDTLGASSTTMPSIYVDATTTYVGVGTPTPQHTLDVAGDIGAISFVNTSTRSLKTDISYATASSTDQMLNELVNLKVATYRYTIENQNDPLRIGLIAEDTQGIAPEILSPDGKGVDLYKLATFNIAATQALAARVDSQNMRLTSLETRVTSLESGAISSASGSPLTLSTTSLASAFNAFGVFIQKGIAQFNTLVFQRLVAATDSTGASSAGSVTILTGNTVAQVYNSLVLPSTKVFITFNSQITGSWWVSDKAAGSFRVVLSAPQTTDVSFDYFLVQTEGQIATSTPDTNLGVELPSGTVSQSGSSGSSGTTAPTITLLGDNPMHISVGGTFVEPGVSVSNGAPYTTFVNGIQQETNATTINTASATTYTITYYVFNGATLLTSAGRSVIVGNPDSPITTGTTTPVSTDTTAPVVTLTGVAAMQLTVGDTFTDSGATATDNTDGDLTAKIVVTGAVNTATVGSYTLTYTATDKAGNIGTASRLVTILAGTTTTSTTSSTPTPDSSPTPTTSTTSSSTPSI